MDRAQGSRGLHRGLLAALVLLSLLLGAFSAFVGWNKAFAPLDVLREHSAWTIHLPIWLGRVVGWLEMLAVAMLFAALAMPRLARFGLLAAAWITINHSVAAIFHVVNAEWHTLTQSAVLIPLCFAMTGLWWRRAKLLPKTGDRP
ncbi:MAG: DoxX family protein [Sphingomonadaceae bacterium]